MSPLHITIGRSAIVALVALPFTAVSADAQGKLEARYGISVAGVPIGKAAMTVDLASDQYAISAKGSASGALSFVVSGEGTVVARGALKDGRPAPTSFTSNVTHDSDKTELRMTLDGGNVTDLNVETAPPAADRVPLTDAHRHGISDPLSALLVPASATLGADACQRTLAIFDGRRRYDLKLSFKRMDQVKAEKGYAGPAAVCAMAFQPVAGHRASSSLVKYLSEGREIELWFAPVAGTQVLVPFRVSVHNMLGNLVVQAAQFEVLARTAAK